MAKNHSTGEIPAKCRRNTGEMPEIMGILNVTPDSFYSGSRIQDADSLSARVEQIVSEGARCIDTGACSTRPGAQVASAREERERLQWALPIIMQKNAGRCILSVDTFRTDIAEWCVRDYGIDIINDVSGGNDGMYRLVAESGAQYVLTSADPVPQGTDIVSGTVSFFKDRLERLASCGADVEKQIILDPGFGFGKTLDENWQLLAGMSELQSFGLPVLAGLSRKSMALKLLGITPEECLPATIAMNMAALERGAAWLRVHDVREAAETVKVFGKLRSF